MNKIIKNKLVVLSPDPTIVKNRTKYINGNSPNSNKATLAVFLTNIIVLPSMSSKRCDICLIGQAANKSLG